jgi:hypothetical protein
MENETAAAARKPEPLFERRLRGAGGAGARAQQGGEEEVLAQCSVGAGLGLRSTTLAITGAPG